MTLISIGHWEPGKPVNLTFAPPQGDMQTITARIADRAGVSVADLRGDNRKRNIAWARQDAYREIRREAKKTLNQIAAYFGDRDHTTILYGIRRSEERAAKKRKEA